MNRPFNNYRTPISDPDFFVGRQKLLKDIGKQPFNVWILLGNRRIGKSSTLQALKWRFLQDQQAFPVFIDLQQRQPESPDHFRYIIAKGLDNDIKEWRKCLHQLRTPESLRKPYQYFSQFCHS